jgi:arsenate reductase (thioredoxin)
MNKQLETVVKSFNNEAIAEERKQVLAPLVQFIKNCVKEERVCNLTFICTHNSRRSHLGQIWAQTMAHYWGIKNVHTFSGGTEVTALNENVVMTLITQGFTVTQNTEMPNASYSIAFDSAVEPVTCFSKLYMDATNPQQNFAAILTCDSADAACPFIPNAIARIAVKYADPKAFDGTPLQAQKYAERSIEIGQEMHFVFSEASK